MLSLTLEQMLYIKLLLKQVCQCKIGNKTVWNKFYIYDILSIDRLKGKKHKIKSFNLETVTLYVYEIKHNLSNFTWNMIKCTLLLIFVLKTIVFIYDLFDHMLHTYE